MYSPFTKSSTNDLSCCLVNYYLCFQSMLLFFAAIEGTLFFSTVAKLAGKECKLERRKYWIVAQHKWRETNHNRKQTEKKFWSACSRIVPTVTSECGINMTTSGRWEHFQGYVRLRLKNRRCYRECLCGEILLARTLLSALEQRFSRSPECGERGNRSTDCSLW